MGARGPKSDTELGSPVLPGQYVEPPPALEPAEVAVWIAVTRALPPDWFDGSNVPLLVQYVRHCHSADLVAVDLALWRGELAQAGERLQAARAQADAKAIGREQRMLISIQKIIRQHLSAHGAQSSHIARLGQKLRLNQKSQYQRADAAGAARKSSYGVSPWEDWGPQ